MIDVKLIKKPKNRASSSSRGGGIATNGNGYSTGDVSGKPRMLPAPTWLSKPRAPT